MYIWEYIIYIYTHVNTIFIYAQVCIYVNSYTQMYISNMNLYTSRDLLPSWAPGLSVDFAAGDAVGSFRRFGPGGGRLLFRVGAKLQLLQRKIHAGYK